jgi:hypothetical protein
MRDLRMKPLFRYVAAVVVLTALTVSLEAQVGDVGPARMVADTSSAFQDGNTLAFHVAGRVPIKTPAPNRLAADVDVTSLTSGEVVGKMTWDLTCYGVVGVPCGHYDVVATFRLPGGTLVNRAKASAVLDPGHPDSFLIGIHPEGKTIEGTGVFEGRRGTVHQSGYHICKECPNFATFDDFWLIELDPK